MSKLTSYYFLIQQSVYSLLLPMYRNKRCYFICIENAAYAGASSVTNVLYRYVQYCVPAE